MDESALQSCGSMEYKTRGLDRPEWCPALVTTSSDITRSSSLWTLDTDATAVVYAGTGIYKYNPPSKHRVVCHATAVVEAWGTYP